MKGGGINFHLRSGYYVTVDKFLPENHCSGHNVYKGNNKITELQTNFQTISKIVSCETAG
jgi:hypothetical protein